MQRRTYLLSFIVVFFTLLTSWAVAQEKKEEAPPQEAAEKIDEAEALDPTERELNSYRIRVGDVISIVVRQHADMSQEGAIVSGNGKIAFPPIGKLVVCGKTIVEAAAEIRKRLMEEEILTAPRVDVLVTGYAPSYAFLVGAVQGTVVLPIHKKVRVLELLASSGHLGDSTADWTHVTVRRLDDKGSLFTISTSVVDILMNGEDQKNIIIFEGDIIQVRHFEDTESAVSGDHVYILGKVSQSGRYPLLVGRTEFTLTKLIVLAGGFKELAKRTEVVIIRKTDTGRVRDVVDVDEIIAGKRPDVELRANDLIYVP